MKAPNYDNFNPNAQAVAEREAAKKKSYNQPWQTKVTETASKTPKQRAAESAARSKALAKGMSDTFDSVKAQNLSRRDAALEIERELADHLGFAESVSVSDVGVILDLPDYQVEKMVGDGRLAKKHGRIDADSLVNYIAMAV